MIQPGKNPILGKKPEISFVGLFRVVKIFVPFVPFQFPVYMMHHVFMILRKPHVLG